MAAYITFFKRVSRANMDVVQDIQTVDGTLGTDKEVKTTIVGQLQSAESSSNTFADPNLSPAAEDGDRDGDSGDEDEQALNKALNIDENETFITQRAGKLFHGSESDIKAVSTTTLLTRKAVKNPFMPEIQLQATVLLKKQKEFEALKKLHDLKRYEFEKRMKDCELKRQDLNDKREQMRERMKKFEKFIRENDAKKQRALTRAQTEKKTTEQKEQERLMLLDVCKQQMARLDRYSKLIGKLKKFENFLQNVLTNHMSNISQEGMDPHVNDILVRYKTLSATNEDLINMMRLNSEKVDGLQTKLTQLQSQRADNSLRLNSELGKFKEIHDKLSSRVIKYEHILEELQVNGKQKMRLLGQANLAIEDLFLRSTRPTLNIIASDGGVKENYEAEMEAEVKAAASTAGSRPRTSPKNTGVSTAASNDSNPLVAETKTKNKKILNSDGTKKIDGSLRIKTEQQQQQQQSPQQQLSYSEKLRFIQDKMMDIKDVIDKSQVIIQKERVKNAEAAKAKNAIDQEKLARQRARELELESKRAMINQRKLSNPSLSVSRSMLSIKTSAPSSTAGTRSKLALSSVNSSIAGSKIRF